MSKRKVSQKVNKIDPGSIKLYGPVPRTIGTLITVLVVTASFGFIGWHQLQASRAATVDTTLASVPDQVTVGDQVYTASSTKRNKSAYPSNFRSRLIFFGVLIAATLALLLVLRLWT